MKFTQSSLALCDPMDCTVHGILQARILEWVTFTFSRGSSQPRDRTQDSHIAGKFLGSLARSKNVKNPFTGEKYPSFIEFPLVSGSLHKRMKIWSNQNKNFYTWRQRNNKFVKNWQDKGVWAEGVINGEELARKGRAEGREGQSDLPILLLFFQSFFRLRLLYAKRPYFRVECPELLHN